MIVNFLFICESLDLDMIWLVNLMILTESVHFRIFLIVNFQ